MAGVGFGLLVMLGSPTKLRRVDGAIFDTEGLGVVVELGWLGVAPASLMGAG